MNKESTTNHLKRSLNTDPTPGNFKLEEIHWDNHHPVHPNLIPFENRTKKIIVALEQKKAKASNKIIKPLAP